MLNKTSLIKKTILILLVLTGRGAFAQFTPVNNLDINTIYIPDSKYKQKDGNVENTEKVQKRIDLGYSFLISNKFDTVTKKVNQWTGMISGSYTQMSDKSGEKDLMPEKLLSSQLGVSYYHSMRNNWGMVNIFSVGINSDLKHIDSHDLYINGGVLFIKTPHPGFSYGFGGFIINALNAPIILPGFMLHVQTESKFKFNIDIPTEISTAYDVTKKMELKLAFRFRSLSYDTENEVDPKKRYLNYVELPLGLEGKWKSKYFDFMLGGGYMLLRNFSFKEAGIKNVFANTPVNKLGSSLFINAGIRFKLQPSKK